MSNQLLPSYHNPPTLLSSAFSQSILIKHIYRHPMREAELQAAREGRSVDNVEVDEEKAREDFLVFFEYVFTFIILSACMCFSIYRMFLMLNLLFDTSLYINS